MAQKFFYPAWRRKVEELLNYDRRHRQDMIELNNITSPELEQLDALDAALAAIVGNAGWPKYRMDR